MVQFRSHPFDSTPIDAIDRRIAQLRGLFGMLGSVAHTQSADDVLLFRSDLVNLTWLVEDYLADISAFAQRLNRAAGKGGV